jgi:hypothetical protein
LASGFTATDPVTFGGAALLLMLVGLATGYIPARRATRVTPTEALRVVRQFENVTFVIETDPLPRFVMNSAYEMRYHKGRFYGAIV